MTKEEAIDIIKCLAWHTRPNEEDVEQAVKALEQESISETDIILTREEYGELVSSEYDNGYAKGYREALEQEPNTWSLDDAREDFMHDVYNTLDFLPTNNEANRIIDIFDRVTSSIKQEPVIDKIKAEIEKQYKWLLSAEATTYNIDIAFDAIRKAAESEEV